MNTLRRKIANILNLRLWSTLLLALICTKVTAQEKPKEISVNSLTKMKLYSFGLGVEREQKISRLSTIYIGASIETVVPFLPSKNSNSDILRLDWSINIAPIFQLGYKYYNNLDQREKLGKITTNNSSSFVGLEYNLINPILINNRYKTKYVNSFSPIFGFQKSISKNTNLEFSIGPSIQTDFKNIRTSGFVKFGLAFL